MDRLAIACAFVALTLGGITSAQQPTDKGKGMAGHGAMAGTEPSTHKTCGQMVKEKAAYPAKMSELLTAVSDNLENHAKWMLADKSKEGKAEADALKKIAKTHRDLAAHMKKAAAEMEKLADKIPPAKHDPSLMPPGTLELMKKQATLDREMAKLLEQDAVEMQ